jgi:hypothetical protein
MLLLMIGDEFTSPVDPTEDVDYVADADPSVDEPEQIGSERQKFPYVPMQKSRLPISRSNPWPNLPKAERRAGGCSKID